MRRLIGIVLVALGACGESGSITGPGEGPAPKDTTVILPVPADAAAVYTTNVAWMSAADSTTVVRKYTEHLQALALLFNTHSDIEATALALLAYTEAYRRVGPVKFGYAVGLLGGHIASGGGFEIARNPIGLASTNGKCPVFIVINGIFNSLDASAIFRELIERMLQGMPLVCQPEVIAFYNGSSHFISDAVSACMMQNVQLGDYGAYTKCQGVPNDLIQASRQIADLTHLWPFGIEEEAIRLAEIVSSYRAKGVPVLMIAHSQGALMAAQAMSVLNYDRCIEAFLFGSPLGRASFGRWKYDISGFLVQGSKSVDFVSYLGANDFLKIRTAVSDSADAEVNRWSQVADAIGFEKIFGQNVRLHALVASYLMPPEARDFIKKSLNYFITNAYQDPTCSW